MRFSHEKYILLVLLNFMVPVKKRSVVSCKLMCFVMIYLPQNKISFIAESRHCIADARKFASHSTLMKVGFLAAVLITISHDALGT